MTNRYLSFSFFFLLSFTLLAQEWTLMDFVPRGRHHPVTFALNGFGYASTGTDPIAGPTRTVYKYDPKADSWETLDNFPGTSRSFGIGYAYNGKGYLGFGAGNNGFLGDIWEFDPETEDWSIVTVCPCEPRRHPAFLIYDNNIYVGMGDGNTGNYNDFWKYDMDADQWTQMDDLPGPARHHPYQFVIDSTLYAGFGHQGFNIYRDWYAFDPATEQWTQMNDLPGEARVAGTQFDHRGYGYVLSGDGDDHSFMEEGEFWQYDAADDSWTQMTSHPGNSLWAPGSFVIEDSVYMVGGQNRVTGVIQNSLWKYALPVPEPPASIAETNYSGGILVYPNPAKDVLNIKSELALSRIQIFNMRGQEVKRFDTSTHQMDVRDLPKGFYTIAAVDRSGKLHQTRWIKE